MLPPRAGFVPPAPPLSGRNVRLPNANLVVHRSSTAPRATLLRRRRSGCRWSWVAASVPTARRPRGAKLRDSVGDRLWRPNLGPLARLELRRRLAGRSWRAVPRSAAGCRALPEQLPPNRPQSASSQRSGLVVVSINLQRSAGRRLGSGGPRSRRARRRRRQRQDRPRVMVRLTSTMGMMSSPGASGHATASWVGVQCFSAARLCSCCTLDSAGKQPEAHLWSSLARILQLFC